MTHSFNPVINKDTKYRIIYSLKRLPIPHHLNRVGQTKPHITFDKPRAIDLRLGDVVKFVDKEGKPHLGEITKIEAYREAFTDSLPNAVEGFVVDQGA